jgi:hypothetical protein
MLKSKAGVLRYFNMTTAKDYYFILALAGAAVTGGCAGLPEPDPKCVPDDIPAHRKGPDPGQPPDYNDARFAPEASHTIQHHVWIGSCVDEEPAPRDPDTNDGISLFAPRVPIQPGDTILVVVDVNTTFELHPAIAQVAPFLTVRVWVDWNDNKRFEPGEAANTQHFKLPLKDPAGNNVNRKDIVFFVKVPASFVASDTVPAVRARVSLEARDGEDLPVGGKKTFGEVEEVVKPGAKRIED